LSAQAAASAAKCRWNWRGVARISSSRIKNRAGAEATLAEARGVSSPEAGIVATLDLSSRDTMAAVLGETGADLRRRRHRDQYGSGPIPSRNRSTPTPRHDGRRRCRSTSPEHASGGRSGQGAETAGPGGDDRLTSSANALVPKQGSEAYDVSKAAVKPSDS